MGCTSISTTRSSKKGALISKLLNCTAPAGCSSITHTWCSSSIDTTSPRSPPICRMRARCCVKGLQAASWNLPLPAANSTLPFLLECSSSISSGMLR